MIKRKTFGSDMNLDGMVTISDYSLWLNHLYESVVLNPSNDFIIGIQNTEFGRFFEIPLDGVLAAIVNMWFLAIQFFIIFTPIVIFFLLLRWGAKGLKKAPEKFSNFKKENREFQAGFLGTSFFIFYIIFSLLDLNKLSTLSFFISLFLLFVYIWIFRNK
jgi:hypothetical protein